MQLRKRDKIKKNIDVFINKDKNIIWNIDFSDDPEITTKAPESLLESLENCINRFEENFKNKVANSTKIEENLGKKELKRIAKKILKVKKLKLGEIAQKVEASKNNLKLWFKNRLTEENEILKIDSCMKIWVLMEMNTLGRRELNDLAIKYFKKDEDESANATTQTPDSQEVIKNLLGSYFPKNKQAAKKSSVHTITKVNGILVMNNPPGKLHSREKWLENGELIPLTLRVDLDEFSFEEVILWDSLKNELKDILIFAYVYLQDLMKEKEKYDIDRKALEGLALKLAKDILVQKEEYEVLVKNSDIIANFQMTTGTTFSSESLVVITLAVDEDEAQFKDTFEWSLSNDMSSAEVFLENLCLDLNFPERLKRDLLIQMKQQIIDELKLRLKKMLACYQSLLPSAFPADISLDGSEKPEEESLLKRSLIEKKRLNLRKFSGGVSSPDDFPSIRQEIAHTFTETLPLMPENYEPYEDTYYLQKNEMYQFLEKNTNMLSADKKKILETHSSFYKAFASLIQQSRNQSQRVPSGNRIVNYKNFDKTLPERFSLLSGIKKSSYYPAPPSMNMNKPNETIADVGIDKNSGRNLKTPPFNTFMNMPPPSDYNNLQKYQTYPSRKDYTYPQIQNFNKPLANHNYSGQIMTRSYQGQPPYNQFLAIRNNYNVYPEPNLSNVYGNQMKMAHSLNQNIYSFQSNYNKYPQNIYISNSSAMRLGNPTPQMQPPENPGFGEEAIPKFHDETQPSYKNFNYLGDQIQKKISPSFYPHNEHLYFKNLEVNRDNNDYLNGYANPESMRQTGVMNPEEGMNNDYQNFDKRKPEIEESYFIGESDEFKIKRINSINRFNGQKQIDDFLAINQESKAEGNPDLNNNTYILRD